MKRIEEQPAQWLDELHVRVFTSRSSDIHLDWNIQDVYSSYWRLYVNNRGGAKAMLPRGEFAITPNRVHIIPAWVRFSCFNRTPIKHCFIHFDVLGLSAQLVREVFDRPFTLPRSPQLDALQEQWVSDMRGKVAQDLAVLCRVKSMAYCALGALMRNLTAEQHARCCRHLLGQQSVTPAIDYIDKHLEQPLDNDRLADLCHVSDDHFIRLFKRCLRQTPAQYILDRRIATAAHRLVFSTESIDAIAEQTGFCDRFYFTRVFTRRMGLSPAAYRDSDRALSEGSGHKPAKI